MSLVLRPEREVCDAQIPTPLVSAMVIGVPAAGLAQFSDKGGHVEVKKGTRLCSSIAVEGVRGTLNQR